MVEISAIEELKLLKSPISTQLKLPKELLTIKMAQVETHIFLTIMVVLASRIKVESWAPISKLFMLTA